MQMLFRRLFLCPLGFHERSRRRAQWTDTGMTSACRYCGVPMTKDQFGRWHVCRPTSQADETGSGPAL